MTAIYPFMGSLLRDLWDTYCPVLRQPGFIKLAAAVMAANIAIIGLSVGASLLRAMQVIGPETGMWLAVSYDNSPAEIAGYIQFAAAAVLLFLIYRRTADRLTFFLSGVIAFLLMDDVLTLHDHARVLIANALQPYAPSLATADFGELVYAAAVLAIMAIGLVFAARQINRAALVRTLPIITSILMLGGFATGVDQVHQLWERVMPGQFKVGNLLGIIEDGGELFATGLILLSSAALYQWITSTMQPHQRPS